MKGILGRKAGMTQVFTSDGKLVPVTVIEVKPNAVLQVKTMEKEGYNSLQLGVDDRKEKQTNKPLKGHFKKSKSTPRYFVREIRDMNGFKAGDLVKADLFNAGEFVDVTGISKGKGFQGVIKRYGYSRGPMSHGSQYHRGVGSMGDLTSTVKKSKKLPGHMGDEQKTVQNLQVIAVDVENNALLVKGSIPGANLTYVIVKQAVKLPNKVKPVALVDLNEAEKKNHLLEEGKKYGASISTDLSIPDMKKAIEEARVAFEERLVKRHELEAKAEELHIKDFKHLNDEELEEAISHHIGDEKAGK